MAMNGFLNSDITSENKRRWLRDEQGSADAGSIGHFPWLPLGSCTAPLRHRAGECMSDNTAKTNGALSHKPR